MSKTYFIFGLPGVGKSTVLNDIDADHDIAVFDVDQHLPDDLKREIQEGKLVDMDRWTTFHNNFLNEIQTASTYPKVVATNLILDTDRDAVAKRFPNAWWLHLHVPKDDLHQRLQSRDDHFFNPEIFDDLHELHYPIQHDHTDIDATQPPKQVIAKVKNLIF